jgi:LysM repeat protein
MERICPFLATGIDGRTVVDGFDGGHVCRASDDRRPLERAQQQAYCLGGAHPGCERFADAMRRRGPISWPAPAADATVIQTRLVLPASAARRLAPSGALAIRGRRWLVGGAVATIGVAAVASGVAGSLGGLVAAGPTATATPTDQPTPAVVSTPQATATVPATATPAATSVPTAERTVAPTSTPVPNATPAPRPQTYVVQPGDTLNGIAIRFGTSVQALQDANGLGQSDVIRVGQVLIIP